MLRSILEFLEAKPFQPFVIHTSGGKEYRVPTPDHIGFNPRRTQVIVYFDDEGLAVISFLHITSVELEGAAAA